ncbi:MAG: hypothetical protein U1G07_06880 [Verrucomicrobiota bacterium]
MNFMIQNEDGTAKLQGAAYFYFFVYAMLATAIVVLLVSPFYRGPDVHPGRRRACQRLNRSKPDIANLRFVGRIGLICILPRGKTPSQSGVDPDHTEFGR